MFACVFGGALFGILLHAVLPQHHLNAESKDIVKLGMGLVGTMAALVLGLLVASAKSSYDTQSAEMTWERTHLKGDNTISYQTNVHYSGNLRLTVADNLQPTYSTPSHFLATFTHLGVCR